MEYCEWCGCELDNWYWIYKGKKFCQTQNNKCLKEYLFDEADNELTLGRGEGTVEYSMDQVDEYLNQNKNCLRRL
jgi:hypothetical protein